MLTTPNGWRNKIRQARTGRLTNANLPRTVPVMQFTASPVMLTGTPAAGLALSESHQAAGITLLGTAEESSPAALGAPIGRDRQSSAPDLSAEFSAVPAPSYTASAPVPVSPPGAVLPRSPSPRPGAPSRQPMAVAFASAEVFARALERQAGAAWISVRDGPARGAPKLVSRYSNT